MSSWPCLLAGRAISNSLRQGQPDQHPSASTTTPPCDRQQNLRWQKPISRVRGPSVSHGVADRALNRPCGNGCPFLKAVRPDDVSASQHHPFLLCEPRVPLLQTGDDQLTDLADNAVYFRFAARRTADVRL